MSDSYRLNSPKPRWTQEGVVSTPKNRRESCIRFQGSAILWSAGAVGESEVLDYRTGNRQTEVNITARVNGWYVWLWLYAYSRWKLDV